MPLARLAELHGVATSYSPSPGRTVAASDTAIIASLAALGVDAHSTEAARRALDARERELRERLLPPTVVCWSPTGRTDPAERPADAPSAPPPAASPPAAAFAAL